MMYALVSNAINDFQNGDIIQGLLRPITDIFGSNIDISGQYVYGALFGIMFGMLLLKTQSVAMPVVVVILAFPTLYFLLPPGAMDIFYALTALSVAGIITKVFLKRGS